MNQGTVQTSIEREKDRVFPKEQPAKEKTSPDPISAKTDRGPLSAPDLKQEGRSNGRTGEQDRSSVREKLSGYRAEASRQRQEQARARAQPLDQRTSDAVRNAVKSVPGKKASGKDR